MKNALRYSKAIAAFVGALSTALLGNYRPDTKAGHVLTLAVVVATVVATYRVPNAE